MEVSKLRELTKKEKFMILSALIMQQDELEIEQVLNDEEEELGTEIGKKEFKIDDTENIEENVMLEMTSIIQSLIREFYEEISK